MPKPSPYQFVVSQREAKAFEFSDPANPGTPLKVFAKRMSKFQVADAQTLAQQMVDDLAANRIQIPSPSGDEIKLTLNTAFVAQCVALGQNCPDEDKFSAVEVVQFMSMSDALMDGFCEVASWVMPQEDSGPLASAAPSPTGATPPANLTLAGSSTMDSSSGASTSVSESSPED